MLDLLQTAHRRVLAAAPTLVAVLALGLAGCGPQDDPTKGDVPPPPVTTGTTPTVSAGDRAAAGGGAKGKQKDGDDDDDDAGSSGAGSSGGTPGGGRRGGGGGSGGSNDSGDDDDDDAPSVPAVRTTLRLTMRDGDPDEFSTTSLSARPGRVTLILRNLSDEEHGIAVAGTDIQKESKAVGKGETVSLTVDLTAGDYEFYCPVDDHRLREDEESGLLTESGLLSVG
jgi:hypothetical protein